jgi:hypothetical protein
MHDTLYDAAQSRPGFTKPDLPHILGIEDDLGLLNVPYSERENKGWRVYDLASQLEQAAGEMLEMMCSGERPELVVVWAENQEYLSYFTRAYAKNLMALGLATLSPGGTYYCLTYGAELQAR